MGNSLPLGRFSLVTLSVRPSDTILEVPYSPKVDKAEFFEFSNGYISCPWIESEESTQIPDPY